MATRKTVKRNVILPLYIDKVGDLPVLDGYTWRELAQGYFGDSRSLPCPQCGGQAWRVDERCMKDGELYPTVERALMAIPRKGLIGLIKQLATRS